MSDQVLNFGCRLNQVEATLIGQHLADAGDTATLVVNTCAVTVEAERQARQAIRRLARRHPGRPIVVTGCAAQIHPERFAAMAEVAAVVGNAEKLSPQTWAGRDWTRPETERVQVNDIFAVAATAPQLLRGFGGRTRAFVQVQTGCDHRCTFCIIPFGRGGSRSVPVGEVARQVATLAAEGWSEIVFTGVDITSYGHDLPGRPRLGELVRRVLALVPTLRRVRLSSLDPVEIDGDLWRLIADEPRLMPHLHLSLQAADDLVLKRMKRRHLRGDVFAVVERALSLRPDMVFGADLIAGFPTESDAMAANTAAAVRQIPALIFTHVFPYSERPGTPAARMPAVPVAERKARAAALRAAGEANLRAWAAAQVGRVAEVLVEDGAIGRLPQFAEVDLGTRPPAAGDTPLVRARLTGVDPATLRLRAVLDGPAATAPTLPCPASGAAPLACATLPSPPVPEPTADG